MKHIVPSFGYLEKHKHMDVKTYRKLIDDIDDKILDLLDKRYALVEKIGKNKRKNGKNIEDTQRENQILKRLTKNSDRYKLTKEFITSIWKKIFEHSYTIEK